MKIRRFVAGIFAGFMIIAAASTAAQSQSQLPTLIKQHKDWGAYSHTGNSGKICYVLSIPKQKQPADRDHGDVFFMVARHPGQNVNFEPQFTVGYPFADESKVILDIDGKKFSMFTKGRNAWIENPAEEPTVVAAMRAGNRMSVSGQSRRGTQTSYSYSLSGVTASLRDIENCN